MNVIVIDLAHQFDVIWMCQGGWMANKPLLLEGINMVKKKPGPDHPSPLSWRKLQRSEHSNANVFLIRVKIIKL